MSCEAYFHVGGYVNKRNYRFYGAENPMIVHEQPIHAQNVTVWCGITNERMIGPYLFEDDKGLTVAVTGDNTKQ